MTSVDVADVLTVPPPRWIEPTLQPNEGRDPLGMQTTTQDRLMPLLLPGILELSRRGRYFSFHPFLLDEYRRRKMPANNAALSTYIKRREWDLGLAVLHCPNQCESSPVGAQRLRRELRTGRAPFPRKESVESPFGGYGLYYRSPLAELGIVARAGTMLGDHPIGIDVLYDTKRAKALAETFRASVSDTAYYRSWVKVDQPLTLDVVTEYAAVACLCRLPHLPEERAAVHDALFGTDYEVPAPAVHEPSNADEETIEHQRVGGNAGVTERRRSVAHYLTLVADEPDIVKSETAYRQRLWAPKTVMSPQHELVAGQWAGLVAKDVWQDALCSVWSEWCRAGLDRTRTLGRGLMWEEVQELGRSLTGGPPDLEPVEATADLAVRVASGQVTLDVRDDPLVASEAALEQLRRACVELDSASSGLITLLELARRVADRTDKGWQQATSVGSAWQPPLSQVMAGLRTHLGDSPGPTIADTMWWIVSRFVAPVHERIGYSKLPEFTFRFRWEDGLLVFRDHGVERFPLAAVRFWPLASLTQDLGLWHIAGDDAVPQLTPYGTALIDAVLA